MLTKGVYLTQCRVTYYTKNSMKPVCVSVTISSHCRCLVVGGVGGTGKSFLIEAIKLLFGRIWPSKEVTVAVAAPTGFAAFNVCGLTIHRLFQLRIEHEGKTDEY